MSWEQLQTIMEQNKESRLRNLTQRPISCPRCGFVLDENATGVLNCPMGHYTWRG